VLTTVDASLALARQNRKVGLKYKFCVSKATKVNEFVNMSLYACY
jgi:hypothetical protein